MTSTIIRQALRQWVLEHNTCVEPTQLRDDTPLVANRLITSLQVIDLLLFIESLRERPVEIESFTREAFRDIDTIHRTFFPTEG